MQLFYVICLSLSSSVVYTILVYSTNKIDCHDIAEILLKVVLNTITQTHTFKPITPFLHLPLHHTVFTICYYSPDRKENATKNNYNEIFLFVLYFLYYRKYILGVIKQFYYFQILFKHEMRIQINSCKLQVYLILFNSKILVLMATCPRHNIMK